MKRTIAIVCGGDSSEHDVSMRSGQGLYSFFDKERYNIYIVEMKGTDWNVHLDDGSTARIDKNDFSFRSKGKRVHFDYAYITIHGTPGENGVLQGYFDLLHIPYSTSGVLVEALTFDKFALNNYLRAFGVSVADSILVRHGQEHLIKEDDIVSRLGMPVFVKPAADGSSFGVSKVKTPDHLAPALRKAFLESETVMIEGFLDGTEISQGCYKTRKNAVVLPATEVVTQNEFFDYDAKYNGQVEEITPARLAPETARGENNKRHLRHPQLQRHHTHRLHHQQKHRRHRPYQHAGDKHHARNDRHIIHTATSARRRTQHHRRADRNSRKPVLTTQNRAI